MFLRLPFFGNTQINRFCAIFSGLTYLQTNILAFKYITSLCYTNHPFVRIIGLYAA